MKIRILAAALLAFSMVSAPAFALQAASTENIKQQKKVGSPKPAPKLQRELSCRKR